MSAWTIVAIPSDEDPVMKISSEKVPHLTLLFLGDQTNNMAERKIAEFLLHVTNTTIRRFGMGVDRRGLLGPKNADVLFFGEHNLEKLATLRRNLLEDPEIRSAFNSVEQYPEWTPHLTLGYPESPAHKDDREYPGLGWVNFDKLALWTQDYDGYEFLLKGDESMALAHGLKLTPSDDELTHYGVPGMRWGKRKGVSLTKSDDHNEVAALRKKKPSELSNKELQAINNRKQLEKKYKDLNPTTVTKGHNAVKGVLAIAGTAAAVVALSNNAAVQKGAAAVIKALSGEPGRHAANAVIKTAARHVA